MFEKRDSLRSSIQVGEQTHEAALPLPTCVTMIVLTAVQFLHQ